MARPFKRVGRRGVRLTLSEEELGLLRTLPEQLRSVLEEGDADPVNDRLFPPAYDDLADAEAAAEYRRLMQDELLATKLAAVDTVNATLARGARRAGRGGAGDGRLRPAVPAPPGRGHRRHPRGRLPARRGRDRRGGGRRRPRRSDLTGQGLSSASRCSSSQPR